MFTVFHLDEPRPLAFGRKKKSKYYWTPVINEDVDAAARNRLVQDLVDHGSWQNTPIIHNRGRVHYRGEKIGRTFGHRPGPAFGGSHVA
jgi:hypothetical protein